MTSILNYVFSIVFYVTRWIKLDLTCICFEELLNQLNLLQPFSQFWLSHIIKNVSVVGWIIPMKFAASISHHPNPSHHQAPLPQAVPTCPPCSVVCYLMPFVALLPSAIVPQYLALALLAHPPTNLSFVVRHRLPFLSCKWHHRIPLTSHKRMPHRLSKTSMTAGRSTSPPASVSYQDFRPNLNIHHMCAQEYLFHTYG
jgi:hypothetical protein